MNAATEQSVLRALKGLLKMEAQRTITQNQESEILHLRITALEGALRVLVNEVAEVQPVENFAVSALQKLLKKHPKADRKIKRLIAARHRQSEYLEAVLRDLEKPGDDGAARVQDPSQE
jgi:hypothetical protein